MRKLPKLSARRSPSDDQILRCWDTGMNTAEIARQFSYPEYCVDSRLWRLREERRNGGQHEPIFHHIQSGR